MSELFHHTPRSSLRIQSGVRIDESKEAAISRAKKSSLKRFQLAGCIAGRQYFPCTSKSTLQVFAPSFHV